MRAPPMPTREPANHINCDFSRTQIFYRAQNFNFNEMDVYEEHLRMWLFEEQRPVSFSYLGFELSVSSNQAKQ